MDNALKGRDFLTIADLSPAELTYVLDVAQAQKRAWAAGTRPAPLAGKAVAIVLQKPSMRTRVSFEVACGRLGAQPIMMTGPDGAFSRGETVHDTAKVLERYVDAIVIRTFAQSVVDEIAEYVEVPVVNALTDEHHPCQGLADLLTVREQFGTLEGIRFAYVGDGNNMAHTYLLGGALAGMSVAIATPAGFEPDPAIVARAEAIASETGARVTTTRDASEAVTGAQVIATDTWASMGQEAERAERLAIFEPYRVDRAMLSQAAPDVRFMHCLPAHRGDEVTDEVIDDPCSVVFDEAENRLHAQKALLTLLLG